MNNNEILEGIKKAFKLTIEKLDNHYMFYLDEMVTPKLITLFYWILLFAFITKGLGDIFLEGDFWRGLVWVVGGSLASRVACGSHSPVALNAFSPARTSFQTIVFSPPYAL